MSSNSINGVAGGNTGFASALNNNNRASGNERDMFMTLLVAQLKNQDPLAPQDGAQFVAQLAQFNSLDQLIGIRQALEGMNTGGGNNLSAQAKASNDTPIFREI